MIIWLASYPKSGNTWVRTLLTSLLHSEDGNCNFNNLSLIEQYPKKKHYEGLVKNFKDFNHIKHAWAISQDKINIDKKLKIIKTHHVNCKIDNYPFTNKSNTLGVIHIVRDPRNVITSVGNHFSMNIDESYNFMIDSNRILTADKWGSDNFGISDVLGSWADHYKSWNNIKFAPILIVKYENLINDTKKSLIEIINFLQKFSDIKIDNKKISKTIESCNFENLRNMEKNEGFNEAAYSEKLNKKVNFFHLGKKNNWKNLLDQ